VALYLVVNSEVVGLAPGDRKSASAARHSDEMICRVARYNIFVPKIPGGEILSPGAQILGSEGSFFKVRLGRNFEPRQKMPRHQC
jgi:hypothetical protein